MIYEVGDTALLATTFTDPTGLIPADPTTVTLVIQSPDGTQATIGPGSPIVKISAGSYQYPHIITEAGVAGSTNVYLYRWVGVSTPPGINQVSEGQITIQPTILVPQPVPPVGPAYTVANLAAIDASLLSGELRVQYAERSVTYRSISELLILRAFVATQVAAASGRYLDRQKRVYTSKGTAT